MTSTSRNIIGAVEVIDKVETKFFRSILSYIFLTFRYLNPVGTQHVFIIIMLLARYTRFDGMVDIKHYKVLFTHTSKRTK